ncbi:hypothetical protein HYPBUDRAFT_155891 [Hyphopichia burtonii NRRL Y-1933]|uniref:Uncharacterized protein n=1 Tax=Hyphopichia burtonii NRRL Y-1933 TaxID=984485 RepID=A0A1E4RNT5_9ASCO|nr:hypothetical protein HYPBUDRAFT_155891 [Hyphopichia burtonii NRRL Y-1933]ODV68861.1 hypothetical protein HYPBUDRAFT_155891 [Hyphopichia burtonii NRRL Y-1933]
MDIEEQLERAEQSPDPSLVGSSIRSADDSAHNNYIHPSKTKPKKKKSASKKKLMNSSIGSSLDDLISEGALLGSEEDFTKFLDDDGNVKDDARYVKEKEQAEAEKSSPLKAVINSNDFQGKDDEEVKEEAKDEKEVKEEAKDEKEVKEEAKDEKEVNEEAKDEKEVKEEAKDEKEVKEEAKDEKEVKEEAKDEEKEVKQGNSFYQQEDYSTPNLSEYQLDNQISNHQELLDNVKSHDHHRLPTSNDREISKSNEVFKRSPEPAHVAPLHTEQRRPSSRSRSRGPRSSSLIDKSSDRSRSSTRNPHLARGDSYKNTHDIEPSTYELPADLEVPNEEVEQDEDRRTRQSKPTMGESIAAAEAAKASSDSQDFHSDVSSTRDPSLVTTGDYTNFNADRPDVNINSSNNLYSTRSESSTNYLRSISRSKSRQPKQLEKNDLVNQHNIIHEKNDADSTNLAQEGALISEDPYERITGLDNMVEKVVNDGQNTVDSKDLQNSEKNDNSKEEKNKKEVDVSKELTGTAIESKDTKNNDDPVATEPSEKSVGNKTESLDATDDTNAKNLPMDQNDVPLAAKNSLAGEAAEAVSSTAIVNDESDNKVDESDTKKVDESEELKDEPEFKETEENAQSKEVDAEKVSDVPAETKVEETEKQILDEEAPSLSTKDIKSESTPEESKEIKDPEKVEDDVNVDSAPGDQKETDPAISNSQTVTADEIKVNDKTEGVADQVAAADIEPSEVSSKEPEVTKDETEATVGEGKKANVDAHTEANDDGKESEAKDIEAKDIEAKDIEAKDTESKDIEAKDTESKDTESKDTESKDTESKDTESKDTESKDTESKDTESKDTESKDTESKDTESKDTEYKDTESKDTESKDTKSKDIESKDIETKDESKEEKDETKDETKEIAAEAKPETKAADDDLDFDVSPEEIRKHLESQPVYIFTSFAGGMQIIPRTNRLATILQANSVKFEYRDLGTDESAKKIWKRSANGRTLPGVVRGDDLIGNWEEIDEANEEYKLRELLYETL